MRTRHWITTIHCSFVGLVMVIMWLHFGEILLKSVIFANFLKTFRICFFKAKHYFGHISGMVAPIDVKRKWSALVGYWVQYVTLILDLTDDLDLGCFKVKFQKMLNLRNCLSDWCEMKRKWVNMILSRLYDLALWPHLWPWPWNFKVRVWNSFISEIGRLIDNERKGWVIHSSPWYWLVWPWWGWRVYRIVTGVTSDVGVPSTYLVINHLFLFPLGIYLLCKEFIRLYIFCHFY